MSFVVNDDDDSDDDTDVDDDDSDDDDSDSDDANLSSFAVADLYDGDLHLICNNDDTKLVKNIIFIKNVLFITQY